MKILGVRVDNLSKKETLAKVAHFLEEDDFHQITTINPEFILQAQDNAEFMKILNNSQLCLADGIGLWFGCLRQGRYLKARITGADFIHDILEIADKNNHPIFLAVSSTGLSTFQEVRQAILKIYPHLIVAGITRDKQASSLITIDEKYKILFCNFGSPHQEKFIHSLKEQKNSKIRLAIGVGGGFDFLTGKIRRAPKIFRKTALEWLWRFFQEPRYRAKRIFFAVIIFPLRVIFNK